MISLLIQKEYQNQKHLKINTILIIPTEFETNHPNISLTIFDENNRKIYITKNNSDNKTQIVKLKNNRYAALKPLKNKCIKLDEMLISFSCKELRKHILQYILKNKTQNVENTNNIDN